MGDSSKDKRKKSHDKDLRKEEHKQSRDKDLRKKEHKKSRDKDLSKEEHKKSRDKDLSDRDRRRHSRSPERYRSRSHDRETSGSKHGTSNGHDRGDRSQSRSSDIPVRRLYVGNIPFGVTENMIMDFFNGQMKINKLSLAEGNPIIDCQLQFNKRFSFIGFRSVGETTKALALNGIIFQGQTLKLKRPSNYQPLPGMAETPNIVVPSVSNYVQGSPYKIFLGNLPYYLNEEHIQELLTPFGPLKAFHLPRDTSTGQSKGFAFCCYVDPNITDQACACLNDMQLGDRKLVMQRARVGAMDRALRSQVPVNLQIPGFNVNNVQSMADATEVLCLMNINTAIELEDDDNYKYTLESVKVECGKYGLVKSIEIPRGIQGVQVPGVGKIFVEFNNSVGCQRAKQALSGCKFAGREVVTSFFKPDKYHRREF